MLLVLDVTYIIFPLNILLKALAFTSTNKGWIDERNKLLLNNYFAEKFASTAIR